MSRAHFPIASSGLLAATLFLAPAIHAQQSQDDFHPQPTPGSQPSEPTQGMGAQGAGTSELEGLQNRVRSMQEVMDQVQETDSAGERNELLAEHMDQMNSAIDEMRGITTEDMPEQERQQMMEQRVDVMEQMMGQMVEHMSALHIREQEVTHPGHELPQ